MQRILETGLHDADISQTEIATSGLAIKQYYIDHIKKPVDLFINCVKNAGTKNVALRCLRALRNQVDDIVLLAQLDPEFKNVDYIKAISKAKAEKRDREIEELRYELQFVN